jgi:sugar phosphate permease
MAKTLAYRYVICLIIFLSYILVFFHRLCPAVIALEMQETFRISGTLLGVLASAYFYPYALMQVPSGILADYWGPRKTVTTFFVLAAFGSILMGMAPNLPMAILGRILVGFGVSVLFVSNFKLLSEWFSPSGFTIMGGIFLAMGGIGALSSSLPLAWASSLVGWRMTLVIVGGITLMMAFLIYGLVRNRPSDMGLPSIDTTQRQGRRFDEPFSGDEAGGFFSTFLGLVHLGFLYSRCILCSWAVSGEAPISSTCTD